MDASGTANSTHAPTADEYRLSASTGHFCELRAVRYLSTVKSFQRKKPATKVAMRKTVSVPYVMPSAAPDDISTRA